MSARPAGDAHAERLFAFLRLVAVPVLVASQVYISQPEPTPVPFKLALIGFAVYAVGAVLLRETSRQRQNLLALTDVLFAGALSFTSGGGFSQLRFAFLFVPVATAFRGRPRLTFIVSVGAVAVYLLQALAHPSRSARGDVISFITVQAGYLAWLGAAATLYSYLLARREAQVGRLLAARGRLVAEALAAEERERKRVAEELHDDAIQHLLAARYDLEEAAESDPNGPGQRAYAAVSETIVHLRRTMSELHPYLLDHVGIEAALGSAGGRAADRGGFVLALDVALESGGGNEAVLLRSATELLANAATHAGARNVTVRLESRAGRDCLEVADDGVGFDPSMLDERIREGHIGLLSLRERAEALGGGLVVDTRPGSGSRLELQLPRRQAVSSAAS